MWMGSLKTEFFPTKIFLNISYFAWRKQLVANVFYIYSEQ